MPLGFNDILWSEAKLELVAILGEVARAKRTISYSSLADRLESIRFAPDDARFHELLGDVSADEVALGRGMLSVVVVHKSGDMAPGDGFFALAVALGRQVRDKERFWVDEMKRVYAEWAAETERATTVASSSSPFLARRPRYWLAHRKTDYETENAEGNISSPRLRKDGRKSRDYFVMRQISPGDLVFTFWRKEIRAWGIAQCFSYDQRAQEKLQDGTSMSGTVGVVEVDFGMLDSPLDPKKHWATLGPLLPSKHSPLDRNGYGRRVRVEELGEAAGAWLVATLNRDRAQIKDRFSGPFRDCPERELWEDELEQAVESAPIATTEKRAIILSRRGQGRFRKDVARVERACRITKISREEFLTASHIKPWRDCDNQERLDPYNGLFLAPHVDFLFDEGFISFEDDGRTILSPVLPEDVAAAFDLERLNPPNVGPFLPRQRVYLSFHRTFVFRRGAQ